MVKPLVKFDALLGLTFNQGEDLTVNITLTDESTNLPIDLTDGIVAVNFPRQGGGTVKRTNGPIGFSYAQVVIGPPSKIISPDHGFVSDDVVQAAAKAGGTLPGGLATSTDYKIVVIDKDTLALTDTDGVPIEFSSQGTVGFNLTNLEDLTLVAGILGQVTLNLRIPVTADINAALAQNFQFEYTLDEKKRIVLIENLLDVYAQPVP